MYVRNLIFSDPGNHAEMSNKGSVVD